MIFVYNILYINNNLLERNIGVFLSPQITSYLRGNNENDLLFSISSTFSQFNYLREREKKRGKMLCMSVLFYFSAYFMLYRALKDLLDYRFSLVAAYIRNLVKNNNS